MNNILVVLDETSGNLLQYLREGEPLLFKAPSGVNGNVADYADELWGVLKDESRPCVLIASSIGAFGTVAYVARHPRNVMALILLDPSHPRQGSSAIEIIKTHENWQDRDIAELIRFFESTNEASETGRLLYEGLHGQVAVPVLIVGAGNIAFSELQPATNRRIVAERHAMLETYCGIFADSFFRVIPDSGHCIATEKPEEAVALIGEFISAL